MVELDLQLAMQAPEQHPDLPSEDELLLWAQQALNGRKDNAELSIRLVDSEESQTLNHEFRGKDKPTNVLSFPFEFPAELVGLADPGNHIGDLVICVPVVEQEAQQQNKAIKHHWAHMVVHGCLHLLGYDHIKDDEAEEMEDLERQILAGLNIPDPYTLTN